MSSPAAPTRYAIGAYELDTQQKIVLRDGTSREVTRETLAEAPETALRLLSISIPLLAVALVLARAT